MIFKHVLFCFLNKIENERGEYNNIYKEKTLNVNKDSRQFIFLYILFTFMLNMIIIIIKVNPFSILFYCLSF